MKPLHLIYSLSICCSMVFLSVCSEAPKKKTQSQNTDNQSTPLDGDDKKSADQFAESEQKSPAELPQTPSSDIRACSEELKKIEQEIAKLNQSAAIGCLEDSDCVSGDKGVGVQDCSVPQKTIYSVNKEAELDGIKAKIAPLKTKRDQLFKKCPYDDGGNCMARPGEGQQFIRKCFEPNAVQKQAFCGLRIGPAE